MDVWHWELSESVGQDTFPAFPVVQVYTYPLAFYTEEAHKEC